MSNTNVHSRNGVEREHLLRPSPSSLPATMTAVVTTRHGGLHGIQIRTDVPRPDPGPTRFSFAVRGMVPAKPSSVIELTRRADLCPPIVAFDGLESFLDVQRSFMARNHVGKIIARVNSRDPSASDMARRRRDERR